MSDTVLLCHGPIELALHEIRSGDGRALLLLHGLGERTPVSVPWAGACRGLREPQLRRIGSPPSRPRPTERPTAVLMRRCQLNQLGARGLPGEVHT